MAHEEKTGNKVYWRSEKKEKETKMNVKLFTLLVVSAVLVSFAGSAMAADFVTRVLGYGTLFDEDHNKSRGIIGRPVVRYDGVGDQTLKIAIQFDFDLM